MNPNREELLQRRRDLQRRILRDTQRVSIADVLDVLGESGVAHEIIWPDAEAGYGWSWIEERFPLGFARVRWSDVPGAVCTRWGLEGERDQLFRSALTHHVRNASEEVIVVWGNTAKPSIRISAAAANDHCTTILDSDFDTWVYAPAGDWLIECYHEGELCSGRV